MGCTCCGRVLQRSTAGTKNSTHGDQLYIWLYWGSKMRTNPHSTQILAAFVLWWCGGCTCGGGGGYGDVCGVLHRSTDPGVLLGYCGVLFTVPGVLFTVPKVTIRHKRRIAVPGFRRWRAGCGWSYGTAQGTLPCYLKRRCSGLLAGFSSARGAYHMPNPRRPLGTVYSTAVPARPSVHSQRISFLNLAAAHRGATS